MYAEGKGVEQNYLIAADWYRRAAAQGNTDAQHNLGILYRDGLGFKKDLAEAQKWFNLSVPNDARLKGEGGNSPDHELPTETDRAANNGIGLFKRLKQKLWS